jgi:uncharacterized repeat protein (TIGR02543 family)
MKNFNKLNAMLRIAGIIALAAVIVFSMAACDNGGGGGGGGGRGPGGPTTTNYTVTFNVNGGSNVATQTINSGGTAVRPANPTRSGYAFDDWYSDSGLTTVYDFSTPVSRNITLYAKWNAIPPRMYDESVIEVVFTGNTETVVLNNLNGHDIYLVKVNTSDSIVSDTNTGGAQAPYPSFQNTGKSLPPSGKKLPRMGHPAADAFNANPPPIVQEAPRRQRALFAPPVVGDKRSFWVETYLDSRVFVQKQATLRVAGQYGNIWVMDENYGSGASANKITSAQAQTLAQKFDQIYPLETNLIG